MCGLFGMMGPGISQKDVRFIRDLAYTSGLRGTDGTGVLQGVTYKKAKSGFFYTVEKLPSEVSFFLWHHARAKEGDRDILDSVTDTFMAGHVRASTRGANTLENTHPFELDELIGMHNGTLMDKKYEHKTKTDSELLFRDIEEKGPMKVLSLLDKRSAYAIITFNKMTGEFMFARNEHRPLSCTWNEKRKVFYWASESGMLRFCADRQDIEYDKIWSFTTDTIHTFRPYDVEVGKKPNWRLQKILHPVVGQMTGQNKNTKPRFQNPPWEETIPRSNVIALPRPNKKKVDPKVKREEFLKECVMCKRKMDLLDQHQGTEIALNKYSCLECDELAEQVAKSIH